MQRKLEGQVGDIGLKVLVVDDEPAICNVFCRFLERRGHHVTVCGSAGEGILLAQSEHVDVVVTDLMLPDMTGLEMSEQLGHLDAPPKVILLTGKPTNASSSRAEELGIYRYVSKPIRATALIDLVEEAGAARTPHAVGH